MPPVVPRYDSAPVQPSGIPNVRVSDDAPLSAFGGGDQAAGVSNALSGINKDALVIIQKEKQKADDTATKDAQLKFVQLSNDLMYHPENGAITKSGRDSFGIHDEYLSQYDKGADDIEKSLTEDQKQVSRLMRQQYRGSLDVDLNRHVRGESVKFETETFKSLISTNRNDAILHYQDPTRIQSSIDIQEKAIISHGKANGLPSEWIKDATMEASSKTHQGVIDAMLSNGQDMAAQKYYNANIDGIDGDTRKDIATRLQDGTIKGNAQRATDKITSSVDGLSEALQETKKISDVKLRDETERRIEHHYALKKAADSEQQDRIYQNISNLAETSVDLDSIHRAAGWDKLSIAERNAVDKRVMDRHSGATTQTDRDTYSALNHTFVNDRAKFMSLKLSSPEYKLKLSDTDFKKFDDMQKDLRAGKTDKADGYLSDQEVVNGILSDAGLDLKAKPNTDEGKRAAKVKAAIDAHVQNYERQSGKKATNEDLRRIAKMQTVTVITEKGFFWDTKKLNSELTSDDSIQDLEVPQSEVNAITKSLTRRGIPVTKEAINKLYLKGLKSGG